MTAPNLVLDTAAGVLLALAIAGAFNRGAGVWSTGPDWLKGWGLALMILAGTGGFILIIARLPV